MVKDFQNSKQEQNFQVLIKVLQFSQQLSISWYSSFGFLLCVLKECSNTMEECVASTSVSMWTTTALKVEAVRSSKTSEHSSITWCKIPQDVHQLMKNRPLFQYMSSVIPCYNWLILWTSGKWRVSGCDGEDKEPNKGCIIYVLCLSSKCLLDASIIVNSVHSTCTLDMQSNAVRLHTIGLLLSTWLL